MVEALLMPRRVTPVGLSEQRSVELNAFLTSDLGTLPVLQEFMEAGQWFGAGTGEDFGNTFQTLAIWIKPLSIASTGSGPTYLFGTFRDAGAGGIDNLEVNCFSVLVSDTNDLQVWLVDDETASDVLQKNYANFFTAGHWTHIVVCHNGDTAGNFNVYKNGVLVTPSSTPQGGSPDMATSTTLRMIMGGGNFSSTTNNPVNNQQLYKSRIYSVAAWDVHFSAFGATEANVVAAIYNGGNGTLDLTAPSGDYTVDFSNLLTHWYRPGYDPDNIGNDYGLEPKDLNENRNINKVLMVDDYPGG